MTNENLPSEPQTAASVPQLQVLAAPSAPEPLGTPDKGAGSSSLAAGPALSPPPGLGPYLSNTGTNGNAQILTPPSPVIPAPAPQQRTRRGKIARLPKILRDLVCLMLRDAVPYKRIALALVEHDIIVTERNISNFKTRGGYTEWRDQQERVLDHQLTQESLVDFLGDSASELPAVGLQTIATCMSKHLLRSDVQENIEAHPEQFAPLIKSFCRLSREILNLQRYRDTCRTIGNPGFSREREKAEILREVDATRAAYTPEKVIDSNDLLPLRQR